MTYFTSILLVILFGGTASLAYTNSVFDYYFLAIDYLFSIILSFKVNRVQHAYIGGHQVMLLVQTLLAINLFLVTSPQIPVGWDNKQIIGISILAVQLVLILTYGFWSDRQESDDTDAISNEKGASIFSKLIFQWLTPLLVKGSKVPLEQSDVWELIDEDKAKYVLYGYYSLKNDSHSIIRNFLRVTWKYLVVQGALALVSSVLSFAGPYYLYKIISHIQKPDNDRSVIILDLFGLFVTGCIRGIVDGQIFFIGRRVGTRARTIVIDEIYKKSLYRANTATGSTDQASLGKVVTLMSVDTERVRSILSYAHKCTLQLPLSIAIAVVSLYMVLGWSSLVGIVIMILLGPLSTRLGKSIAKLQEERLKNTDSRISLANELLQGIRIIKYFAWEEHFKEKVGVARKKELKSIFRVWGAYIGFGVIGSGSGIVIALCTFAVYTLVAGETLDAATAFTSMNLLGVVSELISYSPSEVMQIFKTKVSLKRISDYLKEKNVEKYDQNERNQSGLRIERNPKNDHFVGFRKARFRYFGADSVNDSDSSSSSFELRDLDISFPIGKLSVIIGPTGSGKTGLLLSLLGEMQCVSGKSCLPVDPLNVNPVTGLVQTVAYVSQTAWLLNGTIRDNILFGEPFDAERYEGVIRGCALAKDLQSLEGGDLTEIGEKGINMSGGQKQRISLARACYSRAAIVLLDDPLSAVDAPTANHLLHKALLNLLKNRTVILVSHAVQLVVSFAEHVVVMRAGEVVCQGTAKAVCHLENIQCSRDEFDKEDSVEDKEWSVTTTKPLLQRC